MIDMTDRRTRALEKIASILSLIEVDLERIAAALEK